MAATDTRFTGLHPNKHNTGHNFPAVWTVRIQFSGKANNHLQEQHPEKAGSEDKSLNGEAPSTLDTITVFSYFQEKKKNEHSKNHPKLKHFF